ncbi:MAG: hypothetical protein U1F87_07770 [Kiritimatiellia bacterium]
MYEHHSQPLLNPRAFSLRLLRHFGAALLVIAPSLGVGVAGYHLTEGLGWLDSLLNASMILSGMGPVDVLKTPAGKAFASGYALFSGIVFMAVAGILLAPVTHRLLHRLHLEDEGRRRVR